MQTALAAVSCIAANSCLAVGGNGANGQTPYAVRWNGARWLSTPSLDDSTGQLDDVACIAASDCFAVGWVPGPAADRVGEPLVEHWDGRTWQAQSATLSAGETGSLYSISCVGASSCTAVGTFGTDTSSDRLLVETWNGQAWTEQHPALPSGSTTGVLTGVDCSAADACMAVGSSASQPGAPSSALVEAWNGETWAPTVISGLSQLQSISCTASDACTASARYALAGRTAFERWDGSSWSPAPSPAAGQVELTGVSCAGASACVAVGETGGEQLPAALGRLTRERADARPPSAADLNVGARTVAEHWGGTDWTVEPTPNRAGADEAPLFSVSCVSITSCVAVGTINRLGPEQAAPESQLWDGTSWSLVSAGLTEGGLLLGVSCASANACMAIGAHGSDAMAARWDGTRWAQADLARRIASLDAVACARSTSTCLAVGLNAQGAPDSVRWNGTGWSERPMPNPFPAAARLAVSDTVACAGANFCEAVAVQAGVETVAYLWNGSSWSVQSVALPAHATALDLTSLSCPAAEVCTAAGQYQTDTGTYTLVERYRAGSWRVMVSPGDAGELSNVSCASTSACTVLSEDVPDSFNWDSAGWGPEQSVAPTGPEEEPGLFSLSCPAPGACIAVGERLATPEASAMPTAEIYS